MEDSVPSIRAARGAGLCSVSILESKPKAGSNAQEGQLKDLPSFSCGTLRETTHKIRVPEIRPSTYHEGAVGSSTSNAAGRWGDGTGRGREKADSSQV